MLTAGFLLNKTASCFSFEDVISFFRSEARPEGQQRSRWSSWDLPQSHSFPTSPCRIAHNFLYSFSFPILYSLHFTTLSWTSLPPVDGGHRAIKYSRFHGVKQDIYNEGTHFMVSEQKSQRIWKATHITYKGPTRVASTFQSAHSSKSGMFTSKRFPILSQAISSNFPSPTIFECFLSFHGSRLQSTTMSELSLVRSLLWLEQRIYRWWTSHAECSQGHLLRIYLLSIESWELITMRESYPVSSMVSSWWGRRSLQARAKIWIHADKFNPKSYFVRSIFRQFGLQIHTWDLLRLDTDSTTSSSPIFRGPQVRRSSIQRFSINHTTWNGF